MLGRVAETTAGNVHDWVLERQTRLRLAVEGVRERLQVAADSRKARHDAQVCDAPLEEGQQVYLRDLTVRGRHKIHDLWSPVVYQVMKAPPDGGSVYAIAPVRHSQQVKHVHQTLLKACMGRAHPADGQLDRPLTPAVPSAGSDESDGEDLLALVPEPSQVLSMPAVDAVPITSAEGAPLTAADPGIVEASKTSGFCSPKSLAAVGHVDLRRMTRAGAGQHSNPHRLPRAIGEMVGNLPSQTL